MLLHSSIYANTIDKSDKKKKSSSGIMKNIPKEIPLENKWEAEIEGRHLKIKKCKAKKGKHYIAIQYCIRNLS